MRHPGPLGKAALWLLSVCSVVALLAVEPPPQKPTSPFAPQRTQLEGIENGWKLGQRIYSGGEPAGDASFADLAAHGVRTIISVDGVRPDVEGAAKHGLRYLHLPVGYDGISPKEAGQLTRAVREAKGAVFVHCHHGKHRGPAAAAIACLGLGVVDNAQATAILEAAGTNPRYEGLWKVVGSFETPPDDAELPELPEGVVEEGLAAEMAKLDRAFHKLGQARAAGWDDARPIALLVIEGFRESLRQLPGALAENEQFHDRLTASEQVAVELEESLRMQDEAKADQLFRVLEKNCSACHEHYRNGTYSSSMP